MKLVIWIGLLVGSIIGGWVGVLIGGGWFGLWSISLSTIGSLIGIWVGWKIAKDYL